MKEEKELGGDEWRCGDREKGEKEKRRVGRKRDEIKGREGG